MLVVAGAAVTGITGAGFGAVTTIAAGGGGAGAATGRATGVRDGNAVATTGAVPPMVLWYAASIAFK